jgi:hypothetical protein
MNRIALLTICAACLTQCIHSGPPPLDDAVSRKFAPGAYQEMAPASTDPTRIRVPILKARGFGPPSFSVMADGSYIARYEKGDDYLEIIGTVRHLPRKRFATAGTLDLMGRPARYFVSGNERPEITTEPVILTSPDGGMAAYAIVLGGQNPGLESRMPQFAW